jgi:N-acetylglutamate synthase and related acetyltransferases
MIAITTFDATLPEGVVDLILAVENDEFGFSLSFADQPDLKNIQDSYVNTGGRFWIALDGSKVVGTTALYNLGNGDLALRKMFVLREFRGGQPSLAQHLLDEAFQWARAGEFKRIFLDTPASSRRRFASTGGMDSLKSVRTNCLRDFQCFVSRSISICGAFMSHRQHDTAHSVCELAAARAPAGGAAIRIRALVRALARESCRLGVGALCGLRVIGATSRPVQR